MSPHSSACVVCGNDRVVEVRMILTRWRDPIGSEIYSTIPRCADAKACRDRVEKVLDEPWPVDDGTPATPAKRPTADPEPPIEAPGADVDEEIPWLRA